MVDTKSLIQVSACCTMFRKCATDPFCYSHIDLTTRNVKSRVVRSIILNAGKELRSLRVGCPDKPTKSLLTGSCLAPLSYDHGLLGNLLRSLHIYNHKWLEKKSLCGALSLCSNLTDLKIVGLAKGYKARKRDSLTVYSELKTLKLGKELHGHILKKEFESIPFVSKATRLWDSIMARKGQHEVLASGPIEDLIAHREHRYRISGSAILAAMDQCSQVPRAELLSAHSDDSASLADEKEPSDGSYTNMHDHSLGDSFESASSQASDETLSRVDDRSGKINQTVDVAATLTEHQQTVMERALTEQLKERQEMEKILQKLAKTMDYLERAKREEAWPNESTSETFKCGGQREKRLVLYC